jgi:hypothetical protein
MSERTTLEVVSPRPDGPVDAPPPVAVLLSEPMRRFRCNQKGCCCSGWDIPFRLEDLLRLNEHLPEPERAALRSGVKLVVDAEKRGENGETILHALKLDGVGPDRACRFLEPHGGCRVHATVGLAALPDLCIDFPAFAFRRDDGAAELWFDPVCPEVIERLDEADGPLELHRQAGAFEEPMMALRVQHAQSPIFGRVGQRRLPMPVLDSLRATCLSALGRRDQPLWQTLADLMDAFGRLSPVPPTRPEDDGFVLRTGVDPQPFLRFLWACIGAHGVDLLAGSLASYRRFVFAMDLSPVLSQPKELLRSLSAWPEAMEKWLAPSEAEIRPLALRWLAHRFGTPMTKARAELRAAADSIIHLYGLSLRYASALGAVLQRPVDRALYKVALGAAESCYRGLHLPRDSLPWLASATR